MGIPMLKMSVNQEAYTHSWFAPQNILRYQLKFVVVNGINMMVIIMTNSS